MGSANAILIGNVATVPNAALDNPQHERVSFRVIANTRRRLADGSWVDGEEFAMKVVCWGQLAVNVAQSVGVGDAVVVHGTLTESRWEQDGQPRTAVELKATQVGHDLGWGRATFKRISRRSAENSTARPGEAATDDPAVAALGEPLADTEFGELEPAF